MKRKRLKHYTDIFCDMFTGWRLSDRDIEILQNFGIGKLQLDFLNEKLYLNDIVSEIDLYILGEISAWFKQNLQKDNIDLKKILEAYLNINIVAVERETSPKSRTKRIVQLNAEMTAIIKTDEKEYRTEKQTKWEYHHSVSK